MTHPPKFDGKGYAFDNYAFLLRNFCKANYYDDQTSITYAISTLEERALEWYKDKTNNLGQDPFINLDQFLDGLRNQFVTIEPSDLARIRLDELVFKGDYEAYLDYYRKLKTTLGSTITSYDLASKLIKPLPEDVQL